MARRVDSQRRSVGLMKRTIGISSDAASGTLRPSAWMKSPCFGSQKSVKICR